MVAVDDASALRRSPGDFEISHGGPFYELQRRASLLHDQALFSGRRALIALGIAWAVPLALAAWNGQATGPFEDRPFLLDLGVWARFVVSITIFFIMERMVEERLLLLHRRLTEAPLLVPSAMPQAAKAAQRAVRRRDSLPAEGACAIAALAISLLAGTSADASAPSWLAQPLDGGFRLTPAGWWCMLISNPLFLFLGLRWLWRHLVWALLLRDIARLDLRLVATHPDGMGGLAFIGGYPSVFAVFVLALSCVLAAPLCYGLLHGGVDLKIWTQVMGAWLVFVTVLFALPLGVFVGPLSRLRAATLAAASALATRRERALERDQYGRNVVATADQDNTKASEVSDPAKSYAAASKLKSLPVTKAALLPVGVAALLPLVAVGATQLPFRELLKIARGLLL